MGRAHGAKATYDVSLDRCQVCLVLILFISVFCFAVALSMSCTLSSAAEGPDSVTEEFDLVKNMDIAVREERYNDAGTFFLLYSFFPPFVRVKIHNALLFCSFDHIIIDIEL